MTTHKVGERSCHRTVDLVTMDLCEQLDQRCDATCRRDSILHLRVVYCQTRESR